jgi:hypothetical protein
MNMNMNMSERDPLTSSGQALAVRKSMNEWEDDMAIVRYVLAALKPGVSREEYERYEREVDYVVASKLKSIISYRTHRLTGIVGHFGGGPWDYLERIEITDRAAYEAEIATLGKDLIAELFDKYLDRSKTKSVWTVLVDP